MPGQASDAPDVVFRAKDWAFEQAKTHESSRGDGHVKMTGYIQVKLRNVPACRCVVAQVRKFKWSYERDDDGASYTSFKQLRAELRVNTEVWVVGLQVSGGTGEPEQSEPVEHKIGLWPKMAAAGRPG